MKTPDRDSLTAGAVRRIALWIGVPLTVLGGVQAVTWAADTVATGATSAASATSAPIDPAAATDIRWAIQHGAAGSACAAASPVGDSAFDHVVVPKPSGVNCAAACAANTAGVYPFCRTSIAIGSIRPTQATAYTNVVALNYNYGCNDSQAAYDEVAGQGLDSSYTAYCCCYH